MKRTFLTLTLAVQLAATAALAQTTDPATGTEANGAMSGSFGSDWSTTLGSAMFAEDGTTVRSATELSTQWSTLSEEDKNMIRRDCMMHMQQPGGTTDTTGAATGTTSTDTGAATSGTTGTDSGTPTADSTATGGTGTQSGTTGDTTGTATGSGTATMNVTMEQMDQICAATKDL